MGAAGLVLGFVRAVEGLDPRVTGPTTELRHTDVPHRHGVGVRVTIEVCDERALAVHHRLEGATALVMKLGDDAGFDMVDFGAEIRGVR